MTEQSLEERVKYLEGALAIAREALHSARNNADYSASKAHTNEDRKVFALIEEVTDKALTQLDCKPHAVVDVKVDINTEGEYYAANEVSEGTNPGTLIVWKRDEDE